MKRIFLLYSIIISFNVSSQNEVSKAMIEISDRLVDYEVSRVDTEYFDNRSIEKLFYYDNKSIHRRTITFFSGGQIQSITNFDIEGFSDGVNLEFHENGLLKYYTVENNGTGISIEYYKDGRIKRHNQIKNTHYIGYSSSYCSEGELYSEMFYDSLSYIQEGYHCNSRLRYQGRINNIKTYPDGFYENKEVAIGEWKFWNKEGNLTNSFFFNEGEIIEVHFFDESGKLMKIRRLTKVLYNFVFHNGSFYGINPFDISSNYFEDYPHK